MIQAQGAKAKKSGGGQKPKDMFNKGTEVKSKHLAHYLHSLLTPNFLGPSTLDWVNASQGVRLSADSLKNMGS